jgi:hypothetical protein
VGKRAIPYGIAKRYAQAVPTLHEIFDQYVKIIEIWCNMKKRQI